MVKVGIIGCGSIARLRHAPEYNMNQNAEIVAFFDPMPERAEKLASEFGGKALSNYNDVLNIPGLDAVSICTPNNLHASMTIEALRAGKHVLCEKPMATNLEDARLMIETARQCNRFLMIGHNQRLVETHMKAKEILEGGGLGKVLSFKTSFGHNGPEMKSSDKGSHTWFFKKDSASVGVMGDLGIHKADLIRWLLNDEVDEVCAILSTRDKRNEKGDLIDIEDNATCVFRFNSGIVGNLNSSWTYYGREDNSTILHCEKGTLKIFYHPEYPLIVEEKNGNEVLYKTSSTQMSPKIKSGIVDAFIHSIVQGEKPGISGEEGFEALSIVIACIESHKKKEYVKVKHF